MIDAYVRSMRRRGLATNTIDKRARNLTLFAQEVGLDTNRDAIEDWLDSRGLSSKSRALWLSTLHCFYTWAIFEGLMTEDPTARIKAPRTRRRLPRPVTDAELKSVLKGTNPRLRAMLLLASLAGLRCCEIAALAREDILPDGLLRVLGKGNKERVLPLHPDISAALEALPMPSQGSLFGTTAGAVSKALGDHMHGVGVAGGAHRLRHHFATAVYRSSLDIRLTQELLGHASVATTSIYASADMRKAAGVVGALKIAS